MQSGGQVRYVRADHPDGREHDWIQFHDCVPYLAGGPLRPTLVTLARIDDGGCVGQVFAWSAISGTWAEEEWQLVAPAGSMVLDYRCADGAVSDVRTDRPVRLDELLSWPYRYEAEPTDAPVTFVLNHAPPGEKRAGLSWWLGFGVAFVLVAIGMKRSRS
jgi:hypothetical protein